jgi:hypothetical protein
VKGLLIILTPQRAVAQINILVRFTSDKIVKL